MINKNNINKQARVSRLSLLQRQGFDYYALYTQYRKHCIIGVASLFIFAIAATCMTSAPVSPVSSIVHGLANLTVTTAKPGYIADESAADEYLQEQHNNVVSGVYKPAVTTVNTFVKEPSPTTIAGGSFEHSAVIFASGKVQVATIDGNVSVERLRTAMANTMATPANPIHIDMFSPDITPMGDAPLLYGEIVDEAGRPLRWLLGKNTYTDNVVLECPDTSRYIADGMERLIRKVRIPKHIASKARQAAQYARIVEVYAQKYNISQALIFAIMHTESNFNPYAVSRSNALGLMQVVPETAGEEVHNYLTGTRAVPSSQTLLTPDHNIRYGATYLHILSKNYFSAINNNTSRYLCMIAAYNGGPGAVLRVFDAQQSVAIAKINAMTSDEVHATLTAKMPSAESRKYVNVVLSHYYNYSAKDVSVAQMEFKGLTSMQ